MKKLKEKQYKRLAWLRSRPMMLKFEEKFNEISQAEWIKKVKPSNNYNNSKLAKAQAKRDMRRNKRLADG